MKKLSIFLLVSIFTLSSCSSDSDSNSPSSILTVDDQEFNIIDAKLIDSYGSFYLSKLEYNFVFSDGAITVPENSSFYYDYTTENASISMWLPMISSGNTFQNGVYQFDDNASEDTDYLFFSDFVIFIDGNGDNIFSDGVGGDYRLQAVSGTVTVSGTAPNFTLAIDVILSNDEHFQYTYNSGFDYIDNRND